MEILARLENINVTYNPKSDGLGEFIIEPLLPGYGMTVGNALRRVILTSLEGAAISYIKIDGVNHEFSTLKGMKEDVVELILNLKSLRLRLEGSEPVTLKIDKKGPTTITAADFSKNADVTIVDPNHYLATLDKQSRLSMEATIEKGRGYVTTETKNTENLPLGTITIDSIFTPIKKVHYEVQKTRVGGQTDYDRLIMELTTDSSVTPLEAMEKATGILIDHFHLINNATLELKAATTAKSNKKEKTAVKKQQDKPSKTKKLKS